MNHPDQKVDALLASAIRILKEDPRRPRRVIKGESNEGLVNVDPQYLDSQRKARSNRVVSLSTRGDATQMKEPIMAKAPKSNVPNAFESVIPKAGTTSVDEDGNTVTHNPPAVKEPSKQELKAAEAKAKIEAKAAKKAEAEAKKAALAKEKAEKSTVTTEERAAKKAEREARLEALRAEGKGYVGSMLALADKVKSGLYVKSATGQLRSTNELAEAFDGVTVNGVIQACETLLDLDANPYTHLNAGQQSMNLRNKVRGAITKGTLTIEQVREHIKSEGLDVSAQLKADAVAKAERIAKAKAEREAKAAAKPVKAAEPAEAVA